MLIDDNDIDLFIAEKLLKNVNFAEHIETIMGIETALIRLSNGKQIPDFIFLNLYSNYKSGIDFLGELVLFPPEVRKVKIVVLTTLAFPADEEKLKKFPQVVGYFQKPLQTQFLQSLCNQ